jgi:hypothetical protein
VGHLCAHGPAGGLGVIPETAPLHGPGAAGIQVGSSHHLLSLIQLACTSSAFVSLAMNGISPINCHCRSATPTTPPHEIFEFSDSRQAEILARCCRVWISRESLDPECVHLAEAVLKVLLTIVPVRMDGLVCCTSQQPLLTPGIIFPFDFLLYAVCPCPATQGPLCHRPALLLPH